MIIIIGLGNPGEQYKNTRHNVGFNAIDKIATNFKFPIFNFQSISNSEISQSEILGKKVMLVKPQTFMNESGKSVKKILSKNKDQVSNIIVIHDDVDLPVGKIKIVEERGSAGHKGVESIIQNIGNDGLIRFRIGIESKQSRGSDYRTEAKDIVLKNFSKEEQKLVAETIQKTVDALGFFVEQGLEKTMNEYNK
ncbi:MAG: aminoacyl-tRNA hydrolase [Candidatus Staskawiczbacteria bacterium]|nr:aminoacyl-tRNA hydrolase [Candidatus Staskawiczbacteria bacterium]